MGTSVARWRFSTFTWLAVSLAGVVLASGGCAGSASEGDHDDKQGASASSEFSLTVPPEMGAGSVRICGERERSAHPLYPCRNDIRYDTSDECPCFDFDDNGVPQTDNGPLSFSGLCPSDNQPDSPWIFSYEIWTEHGCSGTQLNEAGNPNNFRCFDIQDLAKMRHMNQSVEWLDVGYNHNQIICLSRNSTKDWDFHFCEDKTLWVECGPHTTVLDCECELVEGQCACPQGSLEILPWNCYADPENACDIWCEGPYPLVEAGFMSFGNARGAQAMQLGAFGGMTEGQAFTWDRSRAYRFEVVYDHRGEKLSLFVWEDGKTTKSRKDLFLGKKLPELNSMELRFTNFEQGLTWIEVSDLRITRKSQPLAQSLVAPANGVRSHSFWLGAFEGNFTVSGKLRAQGSFGSVGEAAKVELFVGRNLTHPPGAR